MNVLSYIFSFLCNQDASRSFVITDHLLPVCQRCTGVYMGMGISFIYLLLSRHYRKGLPPRSIAYVNIACLLAMPIFGFHLFDPGPAWRLWSGLIFGNALVSLLLPATSIICNERKRLARHTGTSTILFWILFAVLNSIPLWFPVQSAWFFYVALLLMLVGLLCVVFCVVTVTIFLIKSFIVFSVLKGFSNEYARSQDSRL
jgi:uncharacterized membrane protein